MTRHTPLWLQAGSYAAGDDRGLIAALWPSSASVGCAVTVSTGMTVNIAPGKVAVPSQNNTGSTLCYSDATEQVTLAAAPGSGTNRYDLVTCQPRGTDLDGGANNDLIFTTVTGVAAATPTVPATPAGQVALAQIYVPGGSASVTAGNIVDVRPGGLNLKPAAPALARTYRNATGTIAAPGGGVLAADTVSFDPAGLTSGAGGQYNCPVTGWYRVEALVGAVSTAVGDRVGAQVYLNGVLASQGVTGVAGAVGNFGSVLSDVIHATAGQYIQLGAFANPGGRSVMTGPTSTYLNVSLLAPG
jgi:hypothetical protein